MDKKFRSTRSIIISFILGTILIFPIVQQSFSQIEGKKELKIGYFPNINHAQAVIGIGNGDFKKNLGENVEIKPFVFNAGPSAIEALFAKQVDVTYVGPNPAINGYVISEGKDVRVISGATSGGAVFVIREDTGINSPTDFANKKFASPQLGNTQDVALRNYLLEHGYKTVENNGNVQILPAKNADILTLFLKKDIDGAWVPEPWGERLIKEANGKLFLDERDLWPDGKFVTGLIIVRTDYLQNNPDVIEKLLKAHVEETQWINNNKEEAIKVFNTELKKITGQTIPEDQLRDSLTRLEFTHDPIQQSLYKSANDAFNVGFLGKAKPDLSNIFELKILNKVLNEEGLATINSTTTEVSQILK
ncbi:MAG TPA: ABC transporter substrate-binding protein [Nitrososphaeraceae archaeon]|nr:ABC transporter substrate-binding protein [Nitrososphaeraceae archaeon]